MRPSCCRRHDVPAVQLAAAKAGQLTHNVLDREPEDGFGVDPTTDTLEVGDVQSMKLVEALL